MHAWLQSPAPSSQYTAKETTIMEGMHCVHERKRRAWKEMLYVWSGWRAVCGGAGGWRTVPWDQWKSWAITCHTCEKDLQVCAKVLKAAVKVAVGVKYPTRLPTITHLQRFKCCEREQESDQLWFTQMEAATCYKKFLQTCVNFSCFNHRWWV